MKFILIECGHGNDPARVVICSTAEARNRVTLAAIFGPAGPDATLADQGQNCLDKLKADKRLDFEGDPPLLWFDGEVVEIKAKTPLKKPAERYADFQRELEKAKAKGDQLEVYSIEGKMAHLETELQRKGIDPSDL